MAIYKENIVDVEMNGSVHRSYCGTLIGEADVLSDRFGVRCHRNGQDESVSGSTVVGYFIRADGSTVVISSGTVDGNLAYVTLPQSCYAVEGAFSLAIKLVGGGITGTVRIVDGAVARTTTSTVVDPGSVIPDISDLLAAIDDLEDAADAAKAITDNIACAYGDLVYPVTPGRYCLKDGKIYMAITTIAASETWTAAHWTEVYLADAVGANTVGIQRADDELTIIGDRTLERYDWPIKLRLGRYLSSGFYDDLANYVRTVQILPAGRYRFKVPSGYSYLPVIYVSDTSGTPVLSGVSDSTQTLSITGAFYVSFMKTDTSHPNFTGAEIAELQTGMSIVRIPYVESLEEKMDLILVGDESENKFNGRFVTGQQVSTSTGAFVSGSEFARTGYIPVKMGPVYVGVNTQTAPSTVFIHAAFYDNARACKSAFPYTGIGVSNANDLYYQTLEAPCDGYLAFDIYAASVGTVEYSVTQTTPAGFVPYTPDSRHINPALITGAAGSEIAESMTFGKSPARVSRATMADGDRLVVETNSIMKNQRMIFFANVTSLDKLLIGHGAGAYGYYIQIDSTKVTYMSNGSSGASHNHGLTISGYIMVILEIDVGLNIKYTVVTSGGTFTKSSQINMSTKGEVFAESDGSSLTNASLAWDCWDYKKAIWAFGDSYFTLYSNTRWPYWITNAWGYDTMLLNAYPGEASETALADLQAALQHGTPKYLFWCIGMNDHDTSSAVNSEWAETAEAVEALCEEHGITLIYSTIPQVVNTSYNNTYKNAYIKTSGYRYVDLAAAVDGVTGWLSNDDVHPSELGGRLLAAAVVAQLPEIIQE